MLKAAIGLLVSFVILCGISNTIATPGLKIRTSKKAIDYASKVALDVLSEEVQGIRLADISGSAGVAIGNVKYEISGTRITRFGKPSTSTSLHPPNSVSWTLSDASVSLSGRWRYEYGTGGWVNIKFSDDGTYSFDCNGIHITVKVRIGASSGRPTIRSESCSASVGSVSIKFHGGASWFYNLFRNFVEDKIKDELDGSLCEMAKKAIDESGSRQMNTMKVEVPIGEVLLLDYRLTSAPSFTSSYMETNHKGTVYSKSNRKEPPYEALPFPYVQSSSKMVEFLFSNYVMDSIGTALQDNGKMEYRLTQKDLAGSGESKYFLNTTCTGVRCIGVIVDKLGKLFPGGVLEAKKKKVPTATLR